MSQGYDGSSLPPPPMSPISPEPPGSEGGSGHGFGGFLRGRWGFLVVGLIIGGVIGAAIGAGTAAKDDTTGAPAATSVPVAPSSQSPQTSAPAVTGTTTSAPSPPSTSAPPPGSSRAAAVPSGEPGTVGSWKLVVVDFLPNANDAMQQENQFNEKPPAGRQYVLVTIRATNTGTKSQNAFFELTYSLIPKNGTSIEPSDAVAPNQLLDRNSVPPGASAEGTIPFLVPTKDVPSVMLYIEDYAFETNSAFFAVR